MSRNTAHLGPMHAQVRDCSLGLGEMGNLILPHHLRLTLVVYGSVALTAPFPYSGSLVYCRSVKVFMRKAWKVSVNASQGFICARNLEFREKMNSLSSLGSNVGSSRTRCREDTMPERTVQSSRECSLRRDLGKSHN